MKTALALLLVVVSLSFLSGCPNPPTQAEIKAYENLPAVKQYAAKFANANPVTDYGNGVYLVSLYSGPKDLRGNFPYNPDTAYKAVSKLKEKGIRSVTPIVGTDPDGYSRTITTGLLVIASRP